MLNSNNVYSNQNCSTYKIPFPDILLSPEWHGVVYAITSSGLSKEQHEDVVNREVSRLIQEFDDKNHDSVSLRLVKTQLVVDYQDVDTYCTLVRFRIRDSY